jgi:hypothetical protein
MMRNRVLLKLLTISQFVDSLVMTIVIIAVFSPLVSGLFSSLDLPVPRSVNADGG